MSHRQFGILLLAGMLGASCISMHPLSPETRLGGRPARDLRLILPASCEFRPGLSLMTDTLTAGRYNPLLEDDDGIYFQASEKVYVRSLIGITTIHDGGIYLTRDNETARIFFINPEGNLERHDLPKHCKYRIETCPDCEFTITQR